MTNHPFEFDLGDHVRDVVTGLAGYITGRAEHLTGCNTYGVQPVKQSGDASELAPYTWFDENRLERTAQARVVLPQRQVAKPATGAGPNPTKER